MGIFIGQQRLGYLWEKIKSIIPTKVSDLSNDIGYITGYTETDPTVPAWAKASTKPSYTASEVGALPDTYVAPVTSVNGQIGAVTIATGENNVIESVTFNGTTATVTNKAAAITATIPTITFRQW